MQTRKFGGTYLFRVEEKWDCCVRILQQKNILLHQYFILSLHCLCHLKEIFVASLRDSWSLLAELFCWQSSQPGSFNIQEVMQNSPAVQQVQETNHRGPKTLLQDAVFFCGTGENRLSLIGWSCFKGWYSLAAIFYGANRSLNHYLFHICSTKNEPSIIVPQKHNLPPCRVGCKSHFAFFFFGSRKHCKSSALDQQRTGFWSHRRGTPATLDRFPARRRPWLKAVMGWSFFVFVEKKHAQDKNMMIIRIDAGSNSW